MVCKVMKIKNMQHARLYTLKELSYISNASAAKIVQKLQNFPEITDSSHTMSVLFCLSSDQQTTLIE